MSTYRAALEAFDAKSQKFATALGAVLFMLALYAVAALVGLAVLLWAWRTVFA